MLELVGKPIDPCFYANKYPDLKKAFGTNMKSLVDHWFQHGKGEGRVGAAR